MRRTQEVGEICHDKLQHRMLVLESDNLEEWELMLGKAMAKGWSIYQDGRVPVNGWYSAWMLKPVDDLQTPTHMPD